MFKKTILCFLAFLLLAGSAILPLGDFSLMRDIPDMYGSYAKITTVDELGVIDFIGDYLLHGKEIFGNNRNDKQQNGSNNVQFQHFANPLNIILTYYSLPFSAVQLFEREYLLPLQPFLYAGHRNALFRPPLV